MPILFNFFKKSLASLLEYETNIFTFNENNIRVCLLSFYLPEINAINDNFEPIMSRVPTGS